jgi:hypothetical protein
MVDENELERGVLALGRLLGGLSGADDHPVLRGQRAPSLKLRDPLDLDEAHPTRADRRPQARLVAEDRNLDSRRSGRLDEPGPLGDKDLRARRP